MIPHFGGQDFMKNVSLTFIADTTATKLRLIDVWLIVKPLFNKKLVYRELTHGVEGNKFNEGTYKLLRDFTEFSG